MSNIPFVTPRARFLDSNGAPLTGGKVDFFEAGTSTLKTIYSDPTPTTPAPNPHPLDTEGYVQTGGVWLGAGEYKMILRDALGAEVFTVDNLPGSSVIGAASLLSLGVVSLVEELRNLEAGAFDTVYVLGYYKVYDGGGGWFRWEGTNNEPDNGGTVIAPPNNPAEGRWLRVLNGHTLFPAYFGALPDQPIAVGANLQALSDWAQENPAYSKIYFPRGSYGIIGQVKFETILSLEFEEGCFFDSFADTPTNLEITCADCVLHNRTPFIDSEFVNFEYNPQNGGRRARPEWWGAYQIPGSDDSEIFAEMLLSTDLNIELIHPYQLGAVGLDFRDRSLFFRTSSSLSLDNASTETFLGDFETEGSGPFFVGPDLSKFRWEKRRLKSSWLNIQNNGLIDFTLYQSFKIGYTEGGSRWGEILWNQSLTFTTGDTGNFTHFLCHSVESGHLLRFEALVKLGSINQGPTHIFDVTSPEVPYLYNTEIYPQWWGALSEYFSSYGGNEPAFVQALAAVLRVQATEDSTISLSGAGREFYLNEPLLLTNPEVERLVTLKEFTLKPNVSFNNPQLLTLSGSFILEKITLDFSAETLNLSNGGNPGARVIARNCSFLGGTYGVRCLDQLASLDISHSRLQGNDSIYFLCNNLILDHNLFDRSEDRFLDGDDAGLYRITDNRFFNMPGTQVAVVLQNNCFNGVVANNYFQSCKFFANNAQQLIFKGNTCDQFWPSFLNPTDLIVTENIFATTQTAINNNLKFLVQSNTSGFIIQRMIVRNNIFRSTLVFEGIAVANLADKGHSVTFTDNSSANVTIPDTVSKGVINFNTPDGGNFGTPFDFTFSIPTRDTWFKKFDYLIRTHLTFGVVPGVEVGAGVQMWTISTSANPVGNELPEVALSGKYAGNPGIQKIIYEIVTSEA